MIQVKFELPDGEGVYKDALYFTEEEYAAITPEQLEAMKQARLNARDAFIEQSLLEPIEQVQPEVLEELNG